MKKQRLLKLAAFLDTVPRKRFDYCSFYSTFPLSGFEEKKCGTTACAMGWAPFVPAFKRAGLKVNADGSFEVPGVDHDLSGFSAAERFFGLMPEQATILFGPVGCKEESLTPKMVAKKIRAFVADPRKETARLLRKLERDR